MVVGGTAARADALAIAGRIATACDVRLFNEVLVAHTQRGLGRVAPVRIPYPIDLALAVLKDVDLLVLVGVPEPVAFFAYPGKPGRLVRDDCTVLTLAKHGEDLLRDRIEEAIVSGSFRPGDRLEEQSLAEQYGVSRTPVREALRQLQEAGLIDIKPRRGAAVTVVTPAHLIHMFEVMGSLRR